MNLKVDRSLSDFFNSAYGYAIFPSIGKGAIGIGGAAGKEVVYQSNRVVGGVNMTQVSLGFQFGGQAYSEVIFFEKMWLLLEDFSKTNCNSLLKHQRLP